MEIISGMEYLLFLRFSFDFYIRALYIVAKINTQ